MSCLHSISLSVFSHFITGNTKKKNTCLFNVCQIQIPNCLCVLLWLQTPYPSDATSFLSLEHLEICSCSSDWWNLLTFILNDAPRLRVLKLNLVCAFPPFFIVCPTVTKCHIVSEALCPARRDGFVEPTKFCSWMFIFSSWDLGVETIQGHRDRDRSCKVHSSQWESSKEGNILLRVRREAWDVEGVGMCGQRFLHVCVWVSASAGNNLESCV